MSTHLPEFNERRHRIIWLFDTSDADELARLKADGWRIVSQQTFGERLRIDLLEPRPPKYEEETTKAPPMGKHGR